MTKQMTFSAKVSGGEGRAFIGRREVAHIEYRDEGYGAIYIKWAESSSAGAATTLLKEIVRAEKVTNINLTPTSWEGAYWTKKLFKLARRKELPPVTWDFYGDYDWEWFSDGRPPSFSKLKKVIGG